MRQQITLRGLNHNVNPNQFWWPGVSSTPVGSSFVGGCVLVSSWLSDARSDPVEIVDGGRVLHFGRACVLVSPLVVVGPRVLESFADVVGGCVFVSFLLVVGRPVL